MVVYIVSISTESDSINGFKRCKSYWPRIRFFTDSVFFVRVSASASILSAWVWYDNVFKGIQSRSTLFEGTTDILNDVAV